MERSHPHPSPNPAPSRGRGDSRWNAVPGGVLTDAGFPKDREESASEKRVLPRDLPVQWTVGGYRQGGWS